MFFCEEILILFKDCRWQAALRIMLSALIADIVAYLGSISPDAGAAPEQQVNQKYMSSTMIYLTQLRLMNEIKLEDRLLALSAASLSCHGSQGGAVCRMTAALSAGDPRHARHEGCPLCSAWTATSPGCYHQAL